ncbi:hypothetical protein [Yonghaparkia sp. Soil809]|uniref:hypothetical protein n=1 Tax=Yonghaparkia sp. Soil809 TaxID=1736417 RepID=UPI0006FBFA42|nr:hypothetical protein [Yonghaparkia sp. Soil809]KRF32738.1 hypothetical protein ASG83_01460 [Yonghaparkia sp. Soil809]
MVLRIDPRRPLVWRTPHSIQIGVDPVVAIIDPVDDGDARLIAALATGVTRSGLGMLASTLGVAASRVDELLTALEPAFTAPPVAAAVRRVAVIGAVPAAGRIARIVADAGHPVIAAAHGAGVLDESIDAAVLVSHHVIDPTEHLAWLRRDIVHVPVVIGEQSATVGPRVEPGTTPCLACVDQARTAADPAWPAIEAQLWGQEAAADAPMLATEAAIEVLRVLRERDAASVRIDAVTGRRHRRTWAPSARCGCRGLDLGLSAAQPLAG